MARSIHIRPLASLVLGIALAATSLAAASGGMVLTVTQELEYEGPEDGPIFQGGCYAGGANYEFEDCEGYEIDSLGLILSGAFIVVSDDDAGESIDPEGASLLAQLSPTATATMSFDAALLNGLPTDVGFMLTDSEGVPGITFDIRVTDGDGNQQTWTVSGYGDDDQGDEDEDDRFVSIFAPTGVASITLIGATPVEIDHIQYSTGAAPIHLRGDFDRSGTGDLLIHKPGTSIDSWLLDDTDETESDCDDDNGDDGDDENESEDEGDDELNEDWTLVGTGDFDNDCDTDLVWRNGSKVKVWLMENGKPDDKVVIENGLSSGWELLAVDDFDGNGSSDILVRKSSSEKLRIWTIACDDEGVEIASNKPIGFGSFKPSKHTLITTGDVNGDGCADIVWRRNSDGDVRGWAMNGTTIQASTLIKNDYSNNWESLGGGDTNGDGTLDLVFRNKNSGNVCVCRLEDDFSVQGETAYEGPSNSSMVACTDIDGNGCADLVWRKNSSSGKVIRWAMTPEGATTSKTIGYVGNTAVRVYGAR
jgi:hypothetical protein